jgi:cytochrome c553
VGRGVPAAGYPALQAQYAVYTMKQLDGYASDARYTKDAAGKSQASPNAPIMATIAGRLTAEDRRNLASYIQGLR